ncbi:general stress protein [Microbacterium sp. RD1]|uniref:general stress protein n=1 Tax=Microbacterium sp. RD1 TaxID=3457313 RepID=UPI003FA5C558
MSMLGGRVPPGRESVGETVAAYPTYEAAQKAVSALIAAEIPARDIAIVGQDLRSVERVTGRLGYATAARSGAVNGLFLGLLFAFIFVLGTPTVQIAVFLGVLLVGIAIGMIFSLVMYSIVRRRRDFASVMQVTAERYEVCVLPTSLARARSTLGPVTQVAAPPRPEPEDAEPPRYGERLPAPGPDAPSSPGGAPEPATPAPSTDEPPAPGPTAADPEQPPRYGERRSG